MDGDGFADVVVGAYGSNASGTAAGRAYVFLGGVQPDGAADLVLKDAVALDSYGYSVGAADVNADGFSDVVVGAPLAGAGDAGRVYLYQGGAVPDAVPDAVLGGDAGPGWFGYSVSGAGDANDDGYDDVLVGAAFDSEGGASAGKTYVFDFARFHVTGPISGDNWSVGALRSVSWRGAGPVDVFLSVDGGASFPYRIGSGAGGTAEGVLHVRVPHQPTRFAKIRVAAENEALEVPRNYDESDSLFTIEAEIALLSFTVTQPENGAQGAQIAWSTDPGPEDLSGYTLERSAAGGWTPVLVNTKETSFRDTDGSPGSRYRLTGINGLGQQFVIGETALAIAAPLSAGPLPYRGGELNVRFATLGGLGGGSGPASVSLYDVSGRLVRTLARGDFTAGTHDVIWDGRDGLGRPVATGVFFLRVDAAGNRRTEKITVIR